VIGYSVRRLLESIPTLLIISLVLFVGLQAVPGGPLQAFALSPHMSQAAKDAVIHRWGLDQPAYIQYVLWLKAMFTGDWQTSFFLNRPVKEIIASRLPATMILMVTAYLLQEAIALPAGLLAALRRYSFFDQFVTLFSYVFYSMPVFWLGLMMLLAFAVEIPIFPVSGIIDIRMTGSPFMTPQYGDWFHTHPITGVLDIARHVVLPATTIAVIGIAGDSRFIRASMLDAIHQDYIRTARAKGLSETAVVLKHALRNALLPVVTNITLEVPTLFSGAVVTEAIFSWPGMGQLFFQALDAYDYPLLMAIMVVSAALVVLFNFIADLTYAWIDPRISYA
jgi:peptide/nickel transport system permease protein